MFDEFVIFDIAKKLKDKGFKEPCFAYYTHSGSSLIFNNTPFRSGIVEDCLYSVNSLPIGCIGADFIDSPTITQVLKWLREDKGLYVDISLCKKGYYAIVYETNFPDNKDYANSWYVDVLSETYEQAAIACIEYVLNNLI
jgi:hypothetical protein